MKTISILFTLVLGMSMTQFALGDSHKGSKAKGKGKHAVEQGTLKREKNKDKERRDKDDDDHDEHDEHDDDDANEDKQKNKDKRASGKAKGQEMRDAKRNGRATEAQERNAASQQVKDDYKTAVKNGEVERVKGKKPWWKLWGSDSE